MKRVLLATTALGLGAGVAFAQDAMMDMAPSITLSGDAEMGVAGSKDDSVRFHTDVNVEFKMEATTDAGVTFGTSVGLNDIEDPGATSTNGSNDTTNDDDNHGGIAIHMSDPDGFGTLTLGDTDGAYDWALSEIVGVGGGSIRDNEEHGGYDGNGGLDGKHDGQLLRWDRAIGSGFSFAASVELSDDTGGTPTGSPYDPIVGVGGQYTMGMAAGTLTLGGGYQMGSWDHGFNESQTAQRVRYDAAPTTSLTTAQLNGAAFLPKATATAVATGSSPHWGTGAGSASKTGWEIEGGIVGGSASMDFGGDMGGLKVILNASVMEADGSYGTAAPRQTLDVEQTYLGLGPGYAVGDVKLGVNVGNKVMESTYDPSNATAATNDNIVEEKTTNGVGFTVGYDLGGGATLKFGIGSSETDHDWTYQAAPTTRSATHDYSTDANSWSLGVAFKF